MGWKIVVCMRREAVFLAKFFMIFAALQAAISLADLSAVNEAIAAIAAGFLGLERNGALVFARGEWFEITNECTGLVSSAVFAAIVFSLRKPRTALKLALFALGAAVLAGANLPRVIAVLMVAKSFGSAAAGIAHVVSWFAMLGIVLLVWYYGTKKIAGAENFRDFI